MSGGKLCELCESEFFLADDASIWAVQRWPERRFCSASCGARAHSRQTYTAADRDRDSVAFATDQLRDRIMRMFGRIALERGLNSRWEAAAIIMEGARA